MVSFKDCWGGFGNNSKIHKCKLAPTYNKDNIMGIIHNIENKKNFC